MLSRLAVLALVCASMSAPVAAQKVAFEKFKLDNGLSVVLHEDHRLPQVVVNLWYHVGAKDEPKGRSGFAHLFEHLMFMGTFRAPNGEFDRRMEKGGGANNASTSADRTNYYSWGPASLLPTLLWLEADRLEHLGMAMDRSKLDLQREVVLNERRQSYENEPYGLAELEVEGLMYPEGHPYHIPVIGTHADLNAATVTDVQEFFATNYVPNNCSLVVAGDFDPAATKALITSLFTSLPRRAEPPHRTAPAVTLKESISKTMIDAKTEFARTSFIWHSPARFQTGEADCDVLARVLGDGITSRLQKRLMHDEHLAQSVSVHNQAQALGSLFRIDVTLAAGVTTAQAEAAVDAELARIRQEGPTVEEIARVAAKIETEDTAQLQSLQERADRLNEYDAAFGTPDGFERDLGRYRLVTAASVKTMAERILDPNTRLVLRVVPAKAESPAVASESKPAAAVRPNEPPSPRDTPPSDLTPRPFTPTAPAVSQLARGVRLMIQERHDLPLVEILIRIPTGTTSDPADKSGLASLTAQLLEEGAGNRDALAFRSALDRLGATISASAGPDATSVSLSVLKTHLNEAAGLLLDAVLAPRFDDEAFVRLKTQTLGDLKQRDNEPNSVAPIVAAAQLYGPTHVLGRPGSGTVTTVTSIVRTDVAAAWTSALASPLEVIAAGDVSVSDLTALLGERLARPEGAKAPTRPAIATPARRSELRVCIVDLPDSPQTVVRYVWPAPPRSDARRAAIEVSTMILGGSFTSRLNQNLREKNGYTYGARAAVGFLRGDPDPTNGPATLSAGAAVRADVTGASLAEFQKEFARMRAGDISDEEVEKARSTIRNDRIRAGESLGGLVGQMSELARFGLAPEEIGRDLAAIAAVDTKAANGVATGVLVPDGGVLVLVGDRKAIAAQLAALGLPAPVIVDAEGRPLGAASRPGSEH